MRQSGVSSQSSQIRILRRQEWEVQCVILVEHPERTVWRPLVDSTTWEHGNQTQRDRQKKYKNKIAWVKTTGWITNNPKNFVSCKILPNFGICDVCSKREHSASELKDIFIQPTNTCSMPGPVSRTKQDVYTEPGNIPRHLPALPEVFYKPYLGPRLAFKQWPFPSVPCITSSASSSLSLASSPEIVVAEGQSWECPPPLQFT